MLYFIDGFVDYRQIFGEGGKKGYGKGEESYSVDIIFGI